MNKLIYFKKIKNKNRKKFIFISISLILLIFFMYQLNFFTSVYPSGLKRFFRYIGLLFYFNSHHPDLPNQSLWIINFKYLWITLKTVTGGTITGLILAIITSYNAASNLKNKRAIAICIKFSIVFLRSFPVLIIILLFQSAFSSILAAWMIFFWSTWLWMHKYFIEIIESSDTKIYWQEIKIGRSKFLSFYKNIYLLNKSRYVTNSFLAYESNVRWSTILGSIGIIGIGFFIENNKNDFQYLGISLFYIFLVVFILEFLIYIYNKYLKDFVFKKTKNNEYYKTAKYNRNKIILCVIIFLVAIIYNWSFVDIFSASVDWKILTNYLKTFFIFDFSDISENPIYYYDYVLIFMKTYVGLYFAFIFSIIYAFFMSEKVLKSYIAAIFKSLLIIIKTVPVLVWFILFNTFLNSVTSITIVLSIVAFRSLAKHFCTKINSYSESEISFYLTLGYNTWSIYCKKILPNAWRDVIGLILFEFENTFRNGISYGIFATIVLSKKLSEYQDQNTYDRIFPLILPAFLFFILLELTFFVIKYFNNKAKKRKTNF
ncbi:ABC transporter permease [Mycoplasmopsis cynos]|uniref:ABC transporter permease subunit n=1 Tax=Mycoplasmopsis cynos TaxID=171284 RepID=UPI002AFF42A9|nr:ABC transporter permease subunit [Mycoplasmopsis cynos]WQQ15769.1 ABC transporter permease [Mycoplasmopsis cynos]